MTTTVYFFLMSITIFILPQLCVRYLLGYAIWDNRVRFLVYAALLPALWYILVPKELNDLREINFLQHAIGGGVAIGFVSLYFISVLKEKMPLLRNLIIQAVFVYFLVSAFGVANELLEFALDYLGIGIFSADRYDVWFDLVANTLGAVSIFLLYTLIVGVYSKFTLRKSI